MAKITLTIEDTPDGKVKIVSDPTTETMIKMTQSGDGLTSAHGYAFRMLREAREESKRLKPTTILIPRLGR